jgi:ABC-2 type transport system ATP-binding protein
VQQARLRFSGPPPPLPAIPGLLQTFRAGNELRVVCVHFNGATEQALKQLGPAELERTPITLEDAFISYLGERGEKSFILPDPETELSLGQDNPKVPTRAPRGLG